MLADVLPGFREVRAPLVAGYLWLLFAWLIVADEVTDSKGELGRLLELGGVLSDVALAAAASFAAYLIGSLSEDVFVRALSRFVAIRVPEMSFARTRRRPSSVPTDALVEKQIDRLENEQARLRAERNLRVSIVTPLAAILGYFMYVDSWWWSIAFVLVVPALVAQAFLRARDLLVVSQGLYELRMEYGLPAESAGEASTREASSTG